MVSIVPDLSKQHTSKLELTSLEPHTRCLESAHLWPKRTSREATLSGHILDMCFLLWVEMNSWKHQQPEKLFEPFRECMRSTLLGESQRLALVHSARQTLSISGIRLVDSLMQSATWLN